MKKLFRLLVVLVLLGVIFSIVGILMARQLLYVQTSNPKPGQVLVILGGGPEDRTPRAIALVRGNYAPRVLVTGDGDGSTGAHLEEDLLRKAGNTNSRLIVEPKSTSTKENAEFTVPILRTNKMTNVILVTSWYHSRRALASFQKAAPEIHFQSLPTKPVVNDYGWPPLKQIPMVLKEYVKVVGYAAKYRIWTIRD